MKIHYSKIWRKGKEFRVKVEYEIFPEEVLIRDIESDRAWDFSLDAYGKDYATFMKEEIDVKVRYLLESVNFIAYTKEDPIHFTETDRIKDEIRSLWK